jgi:hypothetical protein
MKWLLWKRLNCFLRFTTLVSLLMGLAATIYTAQGRRTHQQTSQAAEVSQPIATTKNDNPPQTPQDLVGNWGSMHWRIHRNMPAQHRSETLGVRSPPPCPALPCLPNVAAAHTRPATYRVLHNTGYLTGYLATFKQQHGAKPRNTEARRNFTLRSIKDAP